MSGNHPVYKQASDCCHGDMRDVPWISSNLVCMGMEWYPTFFFKHTSVVREMRGRRRLSLTVSADFHIYCVVLSVFAVVVVAVLFNVIVFVIINILS